VHPGGFILRIPIWTAEKMDITTTIRGMASLFNENIFTSTVYLKS